MVKVSSKNALEEAKAVKESSPSIYTLSNLSITTTWSANSTSFARKIEPWNYSPEKISLKQPRLIPHTTNTMNRKIANIQG